MKNAGKIFEDCFRKSIPDYCLLIRIPDPPQAFSQRKETKFSRKNICDFYCFQTQSQLFYALELKSTKEKYMSFEDINSDQPQKRMIHKHQIIGLLNYSHYKNVIPGFFLNFRDEKKETERTYFQHITDFNIMCKRINKHSFNEIDLLTNNAIKISGNKKRIHYYWDLNGFFINTKKGELL